MLDPPYALWSIWRNISILYRCFLLLLGVISVYSVFVAVFNELRLRSMKRAEAIENVRLSIRVLRNRCETSQQIIRGAFYLFGFVLFLGLQNVGFWLGDGKEPGAYYLLRNCILHFAFAANVFFIFLVVHCVQWVTCRRLRNAQEFYGLS